LLKNGPKKCPATGCSKEIKLSDFTLNKDLEKYIQTQERIRKRREEEAAADNVDDDEVIE